jgi:hypothetical protein
MCNFQVTKRVRNIQLQKLLVIRFHPESTRFIMKVGLLACMLTSLQFILALELNYIPARNPNARNPHAFYPSAINQQNQTQNVVNLLPCFTSGFDGLHQTQNVTSGSGSHDKWFHHKQKGSDKPHPKPDQALKSFKEYLHQYGYLKGSPNGENFTLVTEELTEATANFQHTFGIPVTKELDQVTFDAIVMPRCGREDFINGKPALSFARKQTGFPSTVIDLNNTNHHHHHYHPTANNITRFISNSTKNNHVMAGDNKEKTGSITDDPNHPLDNTKRFAYFNGNQRWKSRYDLTWALSPTNMTSRISRKIVRTIFSDAFATWTAIIPSFSFTEVETYQSADVKISFVSGQHGDSQSFDGVLGILAHAFSPEDGRVHFDAAEFWSSDISRDQAPQALDLQSVAVHEIGHVMGLAHSPIRESIMFPNIAPHRIKRKLSKDDIQGVKQLYGLANPVSNPSSSSVSSHACSLLGVLSLFVSWTFTSVSLHITSYI